MSINYIGIRSYPKDSVCLISAAKIMFLGRDEGGEFNWGIYVHIRIALNRVLKAREGWMWGQQ